MQFHTCPECDQEEVEELNNPGTQLRRQRSQQDYKASVTQHSQASTEALGEKGTTGGLAIDIETLDTARALEDLRQLEKSGFRVAWPRS